MGAIIHDAGCRCAAYHDRGGAFDDGIRRADTDRHAADIGGREPADEDGGAAGPDDRAADMGDEDIHHRAYMHVGKAGGRKRHIRFLTELILAVIALLT